MPTSRSPHVASSPRPGRTPQVIEEPATSIITVPLTDLDRAALEEMARMTGTSIVNVVRIACYHYAKHLEPTVSTRVFGVRYAPPVKAGH